MLPLNEGVAHSGGTKHRFANFDSNKWNFLPLPNCQNLNYQQSKSYYRPHSADSPSCRGRLLPPFGSSAKFILTTFFTNVIIRCHTISYNYYPWRNYILVKDVSLFSAYSLRMSLDLGRAESYISKIENRQTLPSIENSADIVKYIGISCDFFFEAKIL